MPDVPLQEGQPFSHRGARLRILESLEYGQLEIRQPPPLFERQEGAASRDRHDQYPGYASD